MAMTATVFILITRSQRVCEIREGGLVQEVLSRLTAQTALPIQLHGSLVLAIKLPERSIKNSRVPKTKLALSIFTISNARNGEVLRKEYKVLNLIKIKTKTFDGIL